MSKSKYVITITRQFGSLGRPIAKRMSELLGIEFYDRDLVYLRRMQFPLGKNTNSRQDEIFEAQQNIIKFLADKETCIIVGRCSDFLLSEEENALHIFIYAPYEKRVDNCVTDLKMDVKEARKLIVDVDEARDSYHMHYAGYYPDDKNHKDIMIDSSLLGVEGTAEYLVELVRRKFDGVKA